MVNTEEAKQMQNGINIQGKIRDKGEIRTVHRKRDGVEVKVCDAYLADAVGSIKLTLWAEDTERVKDGMEVSIEGGYITSWKEVKQLNIPQAPKGKLEIGESVESCAIREIEEECGIVGLDIIDKLLETYHTYNLSGKKILTDVTSRWSSSRSRSSEMVGVSRRF